MALVPGGGSCLSIGAGEVDPVNFSDELMRNLLKRGYCTLDGDLGHDGLEAAAREARHLGLEGLLERPPSEIADGLLGSESSTRFAHLYRQAPEDAGGLESAHPQLASLDRRMDSLGQLMEPLCPPYLGFELRSRDRGFLLEVGATLPEAEEAPELSPDVCYRWLTTFEAHRVMCLYFLGPGAGSLEMRPYDEVSGSHKVKLEPGTWILLRADMLSHVFAPSGGPSFFVGCFFFSNQSDTEPRRKQREFPRTPLAERLDRWLLDTVRGLKESTENEDELEALTSRAVQRMTNQMFHKGAQVAIRGQACRFPGLCSGIDFYRSLLFTGTDTAEQIPYTRWDNDTYYADIGSEELTTLANEHGWSNLRDRYNCQHGSFIEGLELFDNKFFGLSVMESRGMDPNQRHLLETMYEVAFSAGMTKPKLMKAHIGIYTGGPGTMETEWTSVPKNAEGGALAATSGSAAILSNRLSYTFGMNGPNFLLSADGASSLLAMGLATDALQRTKPQCDAAFALGIDAILHPMSYSQFCWAGQMSRYGRCFTFDQGADGYIRGEGSGGVYMNPYMHEIDGEVIVDEDPPSVALCNGVWTAHSGKSASLSAPSGSQDQELVAGALREADISPLDVDSVDPHGIGSLLGDAVEVMALARAYRGRSSQRSAGAGGPDSGEELLGLGCVKSTFGNGKPLAGMYAVMKATISLELGQLAPSQHLYRVNPHFELDDAPLFFATEHVPQRMNSAFSAVTAKGFGGVCCHAVLWGAVNFDRVSLPRPRLEQREIVYWPGGGGELDDEARPSRSYAIVGSWSSWAKPEPMKADGKGAFSFTVTLGELGFERFQIWLDSDPDRVLHPGAAGATKDMPVRGPSTADEAEGSHWLVAGPSRRRRLLGVAEAGGGAAPLAAGGAAGDVGGGEGDEGALVVSAAASAADVSGGGDEGGPGDAFEIQVLTNGRYRTVTWRRLDDAGRGLAAVQCRGRYFLAASWNQWTLQELAEAETPGCSSGALYRAEARLPASGQGSFVFVRNEDWRQVIYPSSREAEVGGDERDVLGPDEYGRGLEWRLRGRPGDVFELELRRGAGAGGDPASFAVSWALVRHEPPAAQQLLTLAMPTSQPREFYIVGSWDRWLQRQRMTGDGELFVFEVTLRPSRPERFQILVDGDWARALYPGAQDAGLRDLGAGVLGPSAAPWLGGAAAGAWSCWMIGREAEEERGGRFEIQLQVTDGRPTKVSWVKR